MDVYRGNLNMTQTDDNMPKQNIIRSRGHSLAIALLTAGCAVLIAVAVLLVVYWNVHPYLTAELGSGLPDASAFLLSHRHTAEYTATDGADVSHVGNYPVTISVDGHRRTVWLAVRDTQAPSAEPAEVYITIDDTITPDEAVTDIADAGLVTLSWKTKPKFGTAGDYEVVVELCDEGKNRVLVTSEVHIRAVAEKVTVEAGADRPTPADFLLVERGDAEFVTDMDAIPWDVPGEYEVVLRADGKEYISSVTVEDTTAPVIELRAAAVEIGGAPPAEELVASARDATALTYEYVEQPAIDAYGVYTVSVRATDLGGNSVTAETSLVAANYLISREASRDAMTADDLAAAAGIADGFVWIPEDFTPDRVGIFAVEATLDGGWICFGVTVSDTVAPVCAVKEAYACTGYAADPASFIASVTDATAVTVTYTSEPDWSVEGVQPVGLLLTDAGGNTCAAESTVVISPDTTAPEIYGVKDRFCYVDAAVAYFAEVFAEDNADPSPLVSVDTSGVDIHSEGEYTVTYTATDHNGNSTSMSAVYTFVKQTVTDAELDALADQVLSEILTDGMTAGEQARAIFDYVYGHVAYVGTSDKTDWKYEAARGINRGVGDCFTCYSVEYLLLSKIDCEIMSVERLNGATRHYWCLVNLGTGWYHFDGCNAGPNGYMCFMKTDEELAEISTYFWHYDTTLYPDVATESYLADTEFVAG